MSHDAIYVPGRADNERQSAELARECHGAVSECDATLARELGELGELTIDDEQARE